MGRCRRQKQHQQPQQNQQEFLWEGALETIVEFEEESSSSELSSRRTTKRPCKLQIVGIHSPTCTVFARIVTCNSSATDSDYVPSTPTSCSLTEVLYEVVKVIQKVTNDTIQDPLPFYVKELLRLGSVWLLIHTQVADGSLRLSKTRRATTEDDGCSVIDWTCITLRIHYKPNRYPAVYNVDWGTSLLASCSDNNTSATFLPGVIIEDDSDIGYVIVNKPGIVPSHATVDNDIENAMTMLKNALTLRMEHYRKSKVDPIATTGTRTQRSTQQQIEMYMSLPQRLDTETHGLLIVATRKEFASYMGRLLEAKSINEHDTDQVTFGGIQKRYKCLVHVTSIETRLFFVERLQRTNCMVVHYMNPQSPAPKTFLNVDDYTRRLPPTEETSQWLKCSMRIINVGSICQLTKKRTIEGCDHYAMELEIELLTGRTHQIRGQLAELGVPIVGDPLYGHGTNHSMDDSSPFSFSRSNVKTMSQMALQCYSLSFFKPEWTKLKKKGLHKFLPSKEVCSFTLEKAWWSNFCVPMETLDGLEQPAFP